jgi:hypothetical protein
MVTPRLWDDFTGDRVWLVDPVGPGATPPAGRAIAPTKMMNRFEDHGVG